MSGLTKYCDNEDDCAAIPDSICSANRCICDENYIDIDGACRPSHNAKCSEDSDCGIDDSECVEVAGDDVDDEDEAMKVCRCKKDFTVTETGICGRNSNNSLTFRSLFKVSQVYNRKHFQLSLSMRVATRTSSVGRCLVRSRHVSKVFAVVMMKVYTREVGSVMTRNVREQISQFDILHTCKFDLIECLPSDVGEQCMTSLNCYIGNDAEDATECRNGGREMR